MKMENCCPEVYSGCSQSVFSGLNQTSVEQIDEKQMELISKIVYRKWGIAVRTDCFPRLRMRLEQMISKEHYRGAQEICSRLTKGDTVCLRKLVCYVTICHTFFFREPEHFQVLMQHIRTHRSKEIVIWCAACSSGEEPYSLAMTLLDNGITDFHIVASDVNRHVLSEFNKGLYHESRFSQTSPALRSRYFTAAGNGYYRIDRQLRSYISIKSINLMDAVQFSRPFDYIFCRNVFIYFDDESRLAAVSMMASNLKVGGLLFIGHAENLLSQPGNLKKKESSVFCRTY